MKNPSVLGIVSYKVFPAQMGGQKCVADFYKHMARQTRVILAAARENKQAANQSYPVFPFLHNHWKGLLNLRYLYRLKKLVTDESIDVIIIEHSYFGWLGLLLRRLTKKPVVIRSHNIESIRFRDMQRPWWRLYAWYERKVHREVDHSFFITREDRDWAIRHWHLPEQKCSVVTCGTRTGQPAAPEIRKTAREQLLALYNLPRSTRLFLFNGTLDYLPNTDALRIIINELLPRLQAMHFDFRIFVCGKGLDEQWIHVLKSHQEIVYTGFVENIQLYYQGADAFINPVTLGGGVRIKLVEALAHGQSCISTASGARGIAPDIAGDKLVRVDDYDWQEFADNMRSGVHTLSETPAAFYDAFDWDRIVQKALLSLQTL